MLRRCLVFLGLVGVFVVTLGTSAFAQNVDDRTTEDGGRISVVGGTTVAEGERVSEYLVSIDGRVQIDGVVGADVYVVDGNLVITGRVLDDVVVIGGDAIVSGEISGNLLVFGGRAILQDRAVVGGDVTSSDTPRVASGAEVGGEIDTFDIDELFSGIAFGLLAFLWLAVGVSTAVLGLLFVLLMPGAADAVAASGRRIGSSIGTGIVVGIAAPVVIVLAVITLVGLPFALGLSGALLAASGLGYVTSALCLGRLMVKGPGTKGRIGAFFAGFGILRALALIPGIGALVWLIATIYGIGALTRAAWRAGHRAALTPRRPSDRTSSRGQCPAGGREDRGRARRHHRRRGARGVRRRHEGR